MSQAAINRATRRAKRTRILGEGARCAQCGWADQTALTKRGGRVLCYECRSAEGGKVTTEEHHVLGKDNDATTISVPGNLHRGLSELQREWPPEVRHNTDRDPLLWLAGGALSLRDHLVVWIDWLAAVAVWLVAAARTLKERHGERWWDELGIGTPWRAMGT